MRNRRLSRNITLEEVSGSTGITTAILQTLEDEDREELPAEVYINAFYKKYAQYLEADSEEIKVKYQHEATSMKKPGSASGFSTVITIKSKREPFWPKRYTAYFYRLSLPLQESLFSGVTRITWRPINTLVFSRGTALCFLHIFPIISQIFSAEKIPTKTLQFTL